MIDHEKSKDPLMDTNLVPDDPPPYSRGQTSIRGRPQPSNAPGGRFVAPAPSSSSQPSPRVVISPAEQHYLPEPHNSSYVDLATDKPANLKTSSGYLEMGGSSEVGTPYSPGPGTGGSGFYGPSTGSNGGAGIHPRPSTVGSRKNTETFILMGTAPSGMWLNHVVVATKDQPVQGTYHIDPNLNVQDHATPRRAAALGKKVHARSNSGQSSDSFRNGKRKEKVDLSWHPASDPEPCHAFFESRTGRVDVLLSVGGQGFSRSSKANIDVKSKQGKVSVKLMEIGEGRRVNLDVSTGKGDIELFIPRSFSGPLHVHTEGEITLLPRLAGAMEVISAREDDALVMITSLAPSSSPSPSPSSSRSPPSSRSPEPSGLGRVSDWLHPTANRSKVQMYEGDFANLVSASGGRIIVGFLGEDKVKEESHGMWKKIVKLFTGDKSG